ncbi:hypothetical protein [Bernardetia sp.]|uniref:hypothetical protein n=1 Tax=Bernardetia sp. TaxID=1937974 RepID=UPI0025C536CF|nr:hypothetical protein [Bernardetia sp.]
MYRPIIVFLLILFIPVIAYLGSKRKAPTHYTVPKEYITFTDDAKFNFNKINVNYPYFIRKYGLNLRRIISESSYEGEKLVEGNNLFENISVRTTPIHFPNELVYLGKNANKKHVYKTHVYLHLSMYVGYKFPILDKRKEYILDLGESEVFTTLPPKAYEEFVSL